MGAFIAYLYTNYNIKNFLVIAPGTTVYDKLKKDLGDPANPKYVFKGLDCFRKVPKVISDDDYKEKNISLFDSDINIYVFNIGKLDKENTKIREFNENLGKSFFKKMAEIDDLVMIMDESHHYRAERGMATLNELKPILGLESTATPIVKIKSKQELFKNVVYEYPLSKAIEDGYTRTPYAITRSNVNFYNFGDEQLDKLMLDDGILCHEKTKDRLLEYAKNNNKEVVKPFMLVVCKDTAHANKIEQYIRSDAFKGGKYRNKTIVPLRTAASKILREQMVGRGLRLPYGKRTGDKNIDSVMLTAHDKFNEIIEEAQKGDSIFKAGNVIKAEDLEEEKMDFTQLCIELEDKDINDAYETTEIERNNINDTLFREIGDSLKQEVTNHFCTSGKYDIMFEERKNEIVSKVSKEIESNKDFAEIFKKNECPISAWMFEKVEKIYKEAVDKFIPIPAIKITDEGVDEYKFVDFDLDLSKFKQVPMDNVLLVQNLNDLSDAENIEGNYIDFDGYNPERSLIKVLREKPEIDYSKCSELLIKLILEVCEFFRNKFDENGMQNIIMMNKKDIANGIYEQMMQHFYYEKGFLREEVMPGRDYNLQQSYNYKQRKNLYEDYDGDIRSILFDGIKKGVFDRAKFDSRPELLLARALERPDDFVINWLRPAPKEFNITYNRGCRYEPDFVVETEKIIYLVEVKREDQENTNYKLTLHHFKARISSNLIPVNKSNITTIPRL